MFPCFAGFRSARRRGSFHWLQRSAHAGFARVAAGLTSQARSVTLAALPALPYPRRSLAATPNEPVELDVEIWPTCIVVPPGYRIGLSVRGKDYEYEGPPLVLEGSNTRLPASARFCTRIRRTARQKFLRESISCTSHRAGNPMF